MKGKTETARDALLPNADPLENLQQSMLAALESYSNVHRGSGHYSMVTTRLFERAREIVLEHLGLTAADYLVIFCNPRRAASLRQQLDNSAFRILSSEDLGLSFGVRAIAVRRSALKKSLQAEPGGGTARLLASDWVIWAKAPGRYEPGTPAIVNILAFARALQIARSAGIRRFTDPGNPAMTAHAILHDDTLTELTGTVLLDALRETMIGRAGVVPTLNGRRPFINLDNGASTPAFEPVWQAARKAMCLPSEMQQEILRETRAICAAFLHAPPDEYEIVFTSNTTESINLVAGSLAAGRTRDTETVILNTMLEHNSNDLAWRGEPGIQSVLRLMVDQYGFINPAELESTLRAYNQEQNYGPKRIRLVSVSGASNVLGTYNDIARIGKIVHAYGAQLMVDAAQWVAHREVDMTRCGIDYLAFSAHKVYAPFGCGVLVARKGMLTFKAGETEMIRSSGEENTMGIAALGKSLTLLQRVGMELVWQEEQALTAKTVRGLAGIPGLKLFGMKDPASPPFQNKGGVVVFELKGSMPGNLARELARHAGIGVRYGCHCTHMLIKHLLGIGPALEKIQFLVVTLFPKLQLQGLVRVSLGIGNTSDDIERLIAAIGQVVVKKKIDGPDYKSMMDSYLCEVTQKVFPSY